MKEETSVAQVFTHEDFGEVRTVIIDGKVWAVAIDVCRALGISDTSNAVKTLDDDEKGTYIISTLGGPQEMLVVNEPGLYRLIFKSRKKRAKEFQRWVYHEVIPAAMRGESLTPVKEILIPSDFDNLDSEQRFLVWRIQIDDDDLILQRGKPYTDDEGYTTIPMIYDLAPGANYKTRKVNLDYEHLMQNLEELNVARSNLNLLE